jgi:hypothetical protein
MSAHVDMHNQHLDPFRDSWLLLWIGGNAESSGTLVSGLELGFRDRPSLFRMLL